MLPLWVLRDRRRLPRRHHTGEDDGLRRFVSRTRLQQPCPILWATGRIELILRGPLLLFRSTFSLLLLLLCMFLPLLLLLLFLLPLLFLSLMLLLLLLLLLLL